MGLPQRKAYGLPIGESRKMAGESPKKAAEPRYFLGRHTVRRNVSFLKGYIITVMVVSILTLGYVSQRAEITSVELSVEALSRNLVDLNKKREALRLEITRLSSLDRIDRLARERLNMEPAKEIYIIKSLN